MFFNPFNKQVFYLPFWKHVFHFECRPTPLYNFTPLIFNVLFFRTSLDKLFITIFKCLIAGRSQAFFPYVR
ncbi:hypothetical protein AFSV47Ss_0063 [African swine fever virus]|uniref:Uncharacterized protein n=1 Tax=African swine fever virus TaxID=10497 RepID=A0A6G6AHQ4_ASF|nr:hypothetical protein AFSV47Ss_0063 [African swine fever virus]